MNCRPAVVFLLSLTGCFTVNPIGEDGAGGSSDGTTGMASVDGPGQTGGQVPTTSDTASGGPEPGDASVTTDPGNDFLVRPDVPPPPSECDLMAQDCGRGFKCVPVATNGSGWDGTACVPVVDNPQGPGEACQLENSATGIDDCGWAQYCNNVDEQGIGECLGLCIAEDPNDPWDNLECEDPEAVPTIGCQSCFCVCINPCDPIAQDCSPGQGCYPLDSTWICAPDASDGAGQGSPCEFINGCTAGTFCLAADIVPGCDPNMGAGCCSSVCDLNGVDPCPAQAPGSVCTPWYEAGQAPPGEENIGVCIAPQ